MNRISMISVFLTAIFLSSFLTPLYADDFSELKEQMKVMQIQIKSQAEEMQKMQKKINKLESEKEAGHKTVSAEKIVQMEKEIDSLEVQVASSGEGHSAVRPEDLFHKIEWHGEIEWEFVDTGKDVSTGEAEPHFQLDKIRLEPEIQITENIRFEADLDFAESEVDPDEFYFIFKNLLPFNTTLQIGKDDRFFKANHLTERYPLIANAFWRDEEVGFLLESEFETFYTALAWGQGTELDLRPTGEDDSVSDAYSVLHDDHRKSAWNGIKQVSAGIGIKKELDDLGEIDVLVFGLYDHLSAADIAVLKANLNSYGVETHDQYRAGVNLEYERENFHFFGQFIDAKDGQLERYAWFVQPSYKFELPFGWKYINDHRLLFRYGALVVDSPKTFDKPVSWDREEFTFAVITDIVENFKLKTEYTIEKETTGAGDIDNNEFVMQLEYEF